MHIVLGTVIRDGAGWFDRFASQVNELAALSSDFRAVVLLTDCTDDTPKLVHDWADNGADFPVKVIQQDVGAPFYASHDVSGERWLHFSRMGERVMREVAWPDEVCIFTYTDLIWNGGTLLGLAAKVKRHNAAFAPMILRRDCRYYDTWGTVKGAVPFRAEYPFHPEVGAERDVLVDSAAGCLAIPAQMASGSKWGPHAERSLCANLRNAGCPVMLDTATVVFHP